MSYYVHQTSLQLWLNKRLCHYFHHIFSPQKRPNVRNIYRRGTTVTQLLIKLSYFPLFSQFTIFRVRAKNRYFGRMWEFPELASQVNLIGLALPSRPSRDGPPELAFFSLVKIGTLVECERFLNWPPKSTSLGWPSRDGPPDMALLSWPSWVGLP